jgi:redox-regulated HSP33 family molecular chaperone
MSSVREGDIGARINARQEHRALLQSLNDRLAKAAKKHRFETARIPFQCECAARGCEEFALHTLAEYEELRRTQPALLAPSHA